MMPDVLFFFFLVSWNGDFSSRSLPKYPQDPLSEKNAYIQSWWKPLRPLPSE